MKSFEVELNIENTVKQAIIFKTEMRTILNNFLNFFDYKNDKKIILDVSIVSKYKIRKLNKLYRNKDKVTDILSFDFGQDDIYDKLPIKHIGELVICWDKIETQSRKFNHSLKREFCYLFTHGLVHLQGFDHEEEEERKIMNKMVDDIFEPLNIKRQEG
ncbi:rRNA maturation RNase YbeY [Mycoplasma leonicaptivi]|uniref:rRNA maturation RNase YbeY n=1 Tax=Mycoplasma leonicaptivi TaxID=36742 RepID=UPI000B137662|nr:rRNA maturation RNase YbeY [Mycoplasma leonicaptivi]